MRRRPDYKLSLLIVALLASASGGSAATFAVTSSLDDGSVGTYRWALTQANASPGHDVVTIPPMTITFTSSPVSITESIEIIGAGQDLTIIQAFAGTPYYNPAEVRHVFSSVSAPVILRDATFRGGMQGTGTAPGIHCPGNSLTMERVTVRDCLSGSTCQGVGVWAQTLTATDCTIENNTSMLSTQVLANVGGAYATSNATLTRCTISNNRVLSNQAIPITGGVRAAGNLTLRECTITGNQGKNGGGGVSCGGQLIVDSCTITNNFTTNNGGGILSTTTADNAGPIIRNSIIAGNMSAGSGPDIFQGVQSRGCNIIGTTSDAIIDQDGGSNTSVGDQLNVDPLLEPLQPFGGPTRTHRPSPSSPAIDAGTDLDIDDNPWTTDQRGLPRLVGAAADVGSHERDLVAPTVPGGITLDSPTTTDADSVQFHLTFSESLDTPFTSNNLTLTGSLAGDAMASVAGTGPAYEIVVTMDDPAAEGTIGVELAGVLSDREGNAVALPVASALYTIDNYPAGDVSKNGVFDLADVALLADANLSLTTLP